MEIAKEKDEKVFKASNNGWVHSFFKWINFKFKTETGAKADLSKNEINFGINLKTNFLNIMQKISSP